MDGLSIRDVNQNDLDVLVAVVAHRMIEYVRDGAIGLPYGPCPTKFVSV